MYNIQLHAQWIGAVVDCSESVYDAFEYLKILFWIISFWFYIQASGHLNCYHKMSIVSVQVSYFGIYWSMHLVAELINQSLGMSITLLTLFVLVSV